MSEFIDQSQSCNSHIMTNWLVGVPKFVDNNFYWAVSRKEDIQPKRPFLRSPSPTEVLDYGDLTEKADETAHQ